METSTPQPASTAGSSNNSTGIIIALLVIIILGAGGFMYYSKNNSATPSMMGAPATAVSPTAATVDTMTAETTTEPSGAMMDEASPGAAMAEKVFTIEGDSFTFTPNVMSVKKGDKVKVIFKNNEGFHDWVLDEFNAKTKQIAAGQTDTIEFVADKAGTFEFYCSVGNHRAQGMVGTLTVTE